MNHFTDSTPELSGAPNTAANGEELTADRCNLILNSRVMHDIFVNACPKLGEASPESIRIISKLINAYFYGKNSIIGFIQGICDDEVFIDTIRGIDIIIQEENIQDIQGIETYLSNAEEISSPAAGISI